LQKNAQEFDVIITGTKNWPFYRACVKYRQM
jgi:hypothetical protein